VSFVDGHWFILAERLQDESMDELTQTVSFSDEFPKGKINQAWADGNRVATIAFCNNKWLLITEKAKAEAPAQSILIASDEIPSKQVQECWNETKRVSLLSHGGGVWVLLAEVRVRSFLVPRMPSLTRKF